LNNFSIKAGLAAFFIAALPFITDASSGRWSNNTFDIYGF
jgi:hypothetical protein